MVKVKQETSQQIGNVTYSFDAIRGTQAGREFFVAICPLKTIPKLFIYNEQELPPELRAQRVLSNARIPAMKDYILNNPNEYIFSSLTASVDGKINFIPAPHLPPEGKIGRLYIDMNATLVINDGQHRRKAIEKALEEKPDIGYESISVVFFEDKGLKRSQQMFSDLNKNAVKTSKSLNILYNHRNDFSQFMVKLVNTIDVFQNRVDLEKTSIGNRSTKVFTLNGVTDSTKKLLGRQEIDKITKNETDLIADFWNTVAKNIPQWQLLMQGKIKPKTLKECFVHSNTNCLNSLGIVGRVIHQMYPAEWKKKLGALHNVDWTRDNPAWEGRLLQGGRMVRTTAGIEMGANTILSSCGIKLPDYRVRFERK